MENIISGIGDMDYELCRDNDKYVLFGVSDKERVEVKRDVNPSKVFDVIREYESR